MGGIFGGGGSTISHEENRINALQIQQSTYGTVIPVIFGTNRVAGNLIDYMDFTAIPHTKTTTSGGKGGGGKVTSKETTYTYEVAILFSLCEGPIARFGKVWSDKEIYGDPGQIRFVGFGGAPGQRSWDYMTSRHPERALCYPGTAYLASPNLDLRSTGSLPNLNFEVAGKLLFGGSADAHPADIIAAIIADAQIGVGFPAAYIGDTTGFRNYCTANGILFSPCYTSQTEAQEIITSLCSAANTEPVWSQGKLKFIPYGLETVTGNGVTYTPPKAPIYDLTMDDYVYTEGESPVKAKPNLTADRYNVQPVEIQNRANDYNVEPIKATDDVDVSTRGIRQADSIEMHFITQAAVGQFAAQSILQRQLYTAMQYEFTLSWRHALLEPMDVVTITERDFLGLDHHPVRIIEIEEDDEQNLLVTAEDCPEGVNSPTVYTTQAADRPSLNAAADPGDANPPILFNAPTGLTGGALMVYLAASGQSTDWGGCGVWVSQDGSTYQRVGNITAPAVMGFLSADLPIPPQVPVVPNPPPASDGETPPAQKAANADGETPPIMVQQNPDTTNTLRVDLSKSRGNLYSVAQEAADTYTTLSYVGGELMSYKDAELTGKNLYDVSYLVRGLYGSKVTAHKAGAAFIRLDDAVFRYLYGDVNIGQTIYIKLTSFNYFGKSEQTLDAVAAYTHTLTDTRQV